MKAAHKAEEEPVPYSALLEVAPLVEDESEPRETENQPKKTLLPVIFAMGRFLLLALVVAAFVFCAFGTCTAPRNTIHSIRRSAATSAPYNDTTRTTTLSILW